MIYSPEWKQLVATNTIVARMPCGFGGHLGNTGEEEHCFAENGRESFGLHLALRTGGFL